MGGGGVVPKCGDLDMLDKKNCLEKRKGDNG